MERLGNAADDDTPPWLARKLTDMMFGAAASLAMYVAGVAIACIILWVRSDDAIVLASAMVGLSVSFYRLAVFAAFRRYGRRGFLSDASWITLYSIGAWLFSIDIAVMTTRAMIVGETIAIVLAMLLFSGYLIGLTMRAAVPRFAVPSLLLLFGPMALASVCVPGGEYLVVAVLLILFCLACVRFALDAHHATREQFLAQHSLSEIARHDHLTGLANRTGLAAHVDELSSIDGCGAFQLALIDLDGFKSVNDTHGHSAGDELLRQVGVRVRAVLNGRHFAARLGGDEFAIVFDFGKTDADAAGLCGDIIQKLQHPFALADVVATISASAGLAFPGPSGEAFERKLERADQALYRAKRSGRNRVAISDEIAATNTAPRSCDGMSRGHGLQLAIRASASQQV